MSIYHGSRRPTIDPRCRQLRQKREFLSALKESREWHQSFPPRESNEDFLKRYPDSCREAGKPLGDFVPRDADPVHLFAITAQYPDGKVADNVKKFFALMSPEITGVLKKDELKREPTELPISKPQKDGAAARRNWLGRAKNSIMELFS